MPGSILFAEEYSFGVRKSFEQRTHLVDDGLSWSPGKLSKHVEHVGDIRAEKWA